ncbi:hypothetical protein BV25DRAFT_1902073 [Artomyces pyxidatus]|uniref:Uncharacterized protein n=1 Tax=Artomyces pyxidatus TaxID=48021 RepID=A0ACB8SQL0_9AGAM|nr:hypothetical protein BV25DRAFT_1902073 [Artomyces pyxidatus]
MISYFLFLSLYALVTRGSPVASSTNPTFSSGTTIHALAESSDSCDSIHGCRTLYNIVSGSLVTILACVWTAVHRNIPGPAKVEDSRVRHAAGRVLEVVKIVMVTLLVPEWVLAWAVRQFLNAREVKIKLEKARSRAERAWADKAKVDGDDDASRESADTRTPLVEWTARHGFFVIMGGFHNYENGEPRHPLSRRLVVQLVQAGDLVPPTEDELRGWSQGDALSKGLAIGQTLWFVLQGIARRVEGLPITQLEVMTLAYTTITVAMYVAWWDKPQNIGCPVRVAFKELQEQPSELMEEREWYTNMFYTMLGTQDMSVDLRKEPQVPTFYGGDFENDNNGLYADGVALVAAMVFGAVHCAAWNYAFPSRVEAHVWRISSIAIVAVPGAMLAAMLTVMNFPRRYPTLLLVLKFVTLLIFFFSGPIYVSARLLLLTLSFTTLRSLPFDAYQAVQWTLFIPHFS